MAIVRIPRFRTVAKEQYKGYKNFTENINELTHNSDYPQVNVTINDDVVFTANINRSVSCCGILEINNVRITENVTTEMLALILNHLAYKLIEIRNSNPEIAQANSYLRAGMVTINHITGSKIVEALDLLIDNSIKLPDDVENYWTLLNQFNNPKTQNTVKLYYA